MEIFLDTQFVNDEAPVIVGWREWVCLDALELPDLRAKVDSGAKTSCLHAFKVTTFKKNGEKWVRFKVRPRKSMPQDVFTCEAKVYDRRLVKDSGGHVQRRYVIRTRMYIGTWHQLIELTLTERDNMNFVMLLGRAALAGSYVVDSASSFLLGRPDVREADPRTQQKPYFIGL